MAAAGKADDHALRATNTQGLFWIVWHRVESIRLHQLQIKQAAGNHISHAVTQANLLQEIINLSTSGVSQNRIHTAVGDLLHAAVQAQQGIVPADADQEPWTLLDADSSGSDE